MSEQQQETADTDAEAAPDTETDADAEPAAPDEQTSEKLVELAKRRGYFFQSSGAYGGVGGFYTFGPQGAALKGNVEDAWRDRFAVAEGNMEIDAPTIMPEPVFEASGHLDGFDDMLVECPECGESHRADHVVEDNTEYEDAESLPIPEVEEVIAEYELVCPSCGAGLADQAVETFNLMFATNIGPGDSQPGYLRPETAQGIFVEFPRLKEYARNQLPFGVTQIGRAYRNEISPRRSIIRTREFTQAELEYFVDPEEDEPDLEAVADVEVTLYPAAEQNAADGDEIETTIGEAVDEGIIGDEWVAYFLGVAKPWYDAVGVDMDRFRFRQHLSGERAHYAADCWDAESEIDGNWIEMAGFAYRSDYDLSKHAEYSEDRFTVFRQYDEPKTVERATVDPDMSYLGPEFGGAAQDVVDELESLAGRDRTAFESAAQDAAEESSGDGTEPRDSDSVEIELDGERHEIPVEKTGFAVEEQTEAGEHILPHVVEPSFGVDRLVYTVLHHAYAEDEVDGEERTYLALDPEVAPTFVGVFPLQNDDELESTADEIVADLRDVGLSVTYDDSGNIGRRYRRQDEVGTPFCVTVDYETLENEETTVTVRERDTTDQKRLSVSELPGIMAELRAGELEFDEL
ncbi:glycine--tRNA ligase [Natrialba magadii ATCC 43099]|uniref:glycine--tRNA ligase n=1 Tax=Natrialba magadii (strain ATCC 43099 / DSM 3394 / CCM 3739 / CIP 104546 / IAM 13178 / JCM 8861 / NBRC 102185 / NCIMB 2190 / MS3) TaxID=547559 RepID=D3SVF2_NATMM|nr:glycine--tRNA ligase [Natrialba magadii]ADD05560.1 glycine--tRNA ligase [Natrialba magadii ATCC 43099]ELY30025.1 glycyl-tRNA ligase [Natrialba magadii ATCC 43099]